MPEVLKVLKVNITPEQFLDNCSADELKEIDLLIQSSRYVNKMQGQSVIGFKNELKSQEEIQESTEG